MDCTSVFNFSYWVFRLFTSFKTSLCSSVFYPAKGDFSMHSTFKTLENFKAATLTGIQINKLIFYRLSFVCYLQGQFLA